ncbi:MAG TPA: hypothetical protein VEB86_15840 [Chryseosolibacter sp.]|nr:hypothetical protein [Chryseosolibacter sp.]
MVQVKLVTAEGLLRENYTAVLLNCQAVGGSHAGKPLPRPTRVPGKSLYSSNKAIQSEESEGRGQWSREGIRMEAVFLKLTVMKTPFILAGMLLLFSVAANAQADTAQQNSPVVNSAPADAKGASSDRYRKEDRLVIESAKLPAMLRQTLEESEQYRGWEHSVIYFDRSTKQYVLTLTAVNSTRTYKFDENGKAITDDDPKKNDDQ